MSYFSSYQGFASIYDALMEDAPYQDWYQFLLKNIQAYPQVNNKILDLGCGTGRLAAMLAKQGHHITGVDLSMEMLSMASQRMMEAGMMHVPLIQQDMRELSLGDRYGVIYSFCDTFNYLLEEADVAQSFIKIADHLEFGGLFLFDVHSPFKITSVYGQGPIVDDDEVYPYIWIPEVDPQSLQVDHHLHFFVQEEYDRYRRFSEIHSQRAYTIEQLSDWLRAANLKVISISADFTNDEPTSTSERLFFVTQKIK